MQELAKKVQDALALANNVAEEAISSIRTVRSFANENGEKERYRTSLDKAYKLNIKQSNIYAGYVWCTQVNATFKQLNIWKYSVLLNCQLGAGSLSL